MIQICQRGMGSTGAKVESKLLVGQEGVGGGGGGGGGWRREADRFLEMISRMSAVAKL